MDNKLTDNEIIKALENCLKNECDKCSFKDSEICQIDLMKLLFDLINRQKAIIEKSEKVEHFADKTIATLQVENERLKIENAELKGYKTTDWLIRGISPEQLEHEKIQAWKAEAYKECIGKVNKELSLLRRKCKNDLDDEGVFAIDRARKKVDNLLKELVGGK